MIIVLAVITGAVLLAIEPGDGFPTAASSASGGDTATVTTVTTVPLSTTTTVAAHPTLQEGSTGPDVTVLQQRLNAPGLQRRRGRRQPSGRAPRPRSSRSRPPRDHARPTVW